MGYGGTRRGVKWGSPMLRPLGDGASPVGKQVAAGTGTLLSPCPPPCRGLGGLWEHRPPAPHLHGALPSSSLPQKNNNNPFLSPPAPSWRGAGDGGLAPVS